MIVPASARILLGTFAAASLVIALPAAGKPAPVPKAGAAKHAAGKAAAAAKARRAAAAQARSEADAAQAEALAASPDASRVAEWVVATGDNRGHAYIIVDKPRARVFLFNAAGKLLVNAPTLIGRAIGDDATPAIGRKSLAEIGPAEKTTPAGRFYARFGRAVGQPVLWVDYTTSVALHPIPPANKEHRAARMASPTIDDNRITFGCINVPAGFYASTKPLFRKNGGYVYILPDVKPFAAVFPLAAMQRHSAPDPAVGAAPEVAASQH
jgi:hypothetical protein